MLKSLATIAIILPKYRAAKLSVSSKYSHKKTAFNESSFIFYIKCLAYFLAKNSFTSSGAITDSTNV